MHIGIISDKRNREGVPYLIHNGGPHAMEVDALIERSEISPILKHYRFSK
jgi:uncharacterized protein YijF (DUF1287 family)